MDREQAEKALGIIREVIQNTRDDLVAQNWGLILMILSFVNFAGLLSGTFVDRWVDQSQISVLWYLVPLSAMAVIDMIIAWLLVDRDRGVQSFVEVHIWGIWLTFLVFTTASVFVLHEMEASPKLFCAVFAMTSGIAFTIKGVVFHRLFLVFGSLLLVVMAVVPWVQDIQWLLVGLVWWAAQFLPGLAMYRERRQRQQGDGQSRIM